MDEEAPVEVPFEQLSAATLRAIAEDFCTRDGTDYGETEMSLDAKVDLLLRQLREHKAFILFEAHSQTLRIVTESEREAARSGSVST